MKPMTDRQISILTSLIETPHTDDKDSKLLRGTIDGELSLADIQRVCEIINDEYLMNGINEDYAPNEYGRELEALLDTINAPRLA